MLSESRTKRPNVCLAFAVAMIVLSPAVIRAADPGKDSAKAAKGPIATLYGHVATEAGAPLADVRVRVAIPATDMRFVGPGTPGQQFEARSDVNGDYRLELPSVTRPVAISVDAMKPGYCRLAGTLMAGRGARRVDIAPATKVEVSMTLEPALYFSGVVVDEKGKPISAVQISANSNTPRSSGGIERTASTANGSFELFNYPATPEIFQNNVSKGVVAFVHPDFIEHRIDDVYALAPDQGKALRIVLTRGRTVSGTVYDVSGKPVANAMLKVVRKDGTHRKATLSDAAGKFVLRGLAEGPTTLSVQAVAIKQRQQLRLALDKDQNDLKIRLKAMEVPGDLKKYSVLGMQLADVTPELKSAYDLWDSSGALILDPGPNFDRLQIGELVEGYNFWLVGEKRVHNVREFVDRILAETDRINVPRYRVRVVYSFSRVDFDGTNTQYMVLTHDELKQLRLLSKELAKTAK